MRLPFPKTFVLFLVCGCSLCNALHSFAHGETSVLCSATQEPGADTERTGGPNNRVADNLQREAKSSASATTASLEFPRSTFYRVSTDPSATPDQKRVVSILKQKVGKQDDREAYVALRSRRALSLSNLDLIDISLIADLVNLVDLSLGNNRIKDISPLENLRGLKSLYLSNNRISDISPLAGLGNLEELYLSHNMISGVDALSSLSSLFKVRLDHNRIKDVSSLPSAHAMMELNLGGNLIQDITALARFANREKTIICRYDIEFLTLSNNRIRDLSPLKGLMISSLNLSGNAMVDMEGLVGADGINNLIFTNSGLDSAECFAKLVQLEILNVSGNRISDVSPLSRLENLISVDLSSNTLCNPTPLAGLPRIQSLYLEHNPISDITDLSSALARRDRKGQINLIGCPAGKDVASIKRLEDSGWSVYTDKDIVPMPGTSHGP